MPPVSQSQRALMHGVADGSIPAGRGRPSKAAAEEFAASDRPGKLPAHKAPAMSRHYGKKGVRRG